MAVKLSAGKLSYAREKAKREDLSGVTVDQLLYPQGGKELAAWELLAFVLGADDNVYASERERVMDKLISSFGVR